MGETRYYTGLRSADAGAGIPIDFEADAIFASLSGSGERWAGERVAGIACDIAAYGVVASRVIIEISAVEAEGHDLSVALVRAALLEGELLIAVEVDEDIAVHP